VDEQNGHCILDVDRPGEELPWPETGECQDQITVEAWVETRDRRPEAIEALASQWRPRASFGHMTPLSERSPL